jgi:hypothetical protein
MSDRENRAAQTFGTTYVPLFSGITQALKENTVTFDYNMANGFLMRYEWRRDFSNQPSFLTDEQGGLSKNQNTATVGLLWWWGRKEGAW